MSSILQVQNIEATVKNLLDTILPPAQHKARKLVLPNNQVPEGELANVLGILAKQYNTTLPCLLTILDRVSGDLGDLEKFFKGDKNVEWNEEEDKLLAKNKTIFEKWKGVDATERRINYLGIN